MASASPPHDLTLCKQRVQDWYPHLLNQAYFVPAVYMNRTQYAETEVTGRKVYELQPLSQESDARDDVANRRVLECIHQLAREQVMFVISELQFSNYLKNLAPPVSLPKPQDSFLKRQNKHDGDFDLLIIHREYGILAGELKAFGDTTSIGNMSFRDQQRKTEEKVQKAVKQLEKSRDVLRHLLSHDQSKPRIRMTLMVPNLSRDQLRQVLGAKKQIKQSLCRCLGVDVTTDPTDLCFTSDDVASPDQWWQHCMLRDGADPAMTDDVYQDLVSRFGGPATTVTVAVSTVPRLAKAKAKAKPLELPRPGHGVALTANRFTGFVHTDDTGSRLTPADIVLHPSQLQVLQTQSSPLVFLCGPPGTGKSLLLLLKGLDMIQNKNIPVLVVGTRENNMVASSLLYHQLKEMAGEDYSHLVRYHRLNLPTELHPAVKKLSQLATELSHSASQRSQSASEPRESASEPRESASEPRESASEPSESASQPRDSTSERSQPAPAEVFLIVDEACDDFAHHSSKYFERFCTELGRRMGPGLHLWAASMHHKLRPDMLTEVQLTTPLRTPPCVTRHVEDHRSIGRWRNVRGYQESAAPLPADGPETIEVVHGGDGHDPDQETFECEACGREVGRILKELGVGEPDQPAGRYPQLPRYRDVLVLTWNTFFHEEERDIAGQEIRPTNGLLRGLRQRGFPVTVLDTGDFEGAERVATMTGPDHVIAAGSHFVQGLERMIVVYVETSRHVTDDLDWARLFLISRCTAQLVWVKPCPQAAARRPEPR